MRPKQPGVQSSASDPLRDKASILTGRHLASETTTAREKELARLFVGGLQVVVDGLPGLLAQFKSDRTPGFLLSDCCAIGGVAAGCNILYPDSDDVTAAKLAVDGQIEQGKVAHTTFDLQLGPDCPDTLWP
jgi:hypothetical protein